MPSAVQGPQETRVQSLGRKNPLEEGMATHSGILAWGVPCVPGAWQVQSRRLQRVGHAWSNLASTHTHWLTQKSKNVQGCLYGGCEISCVS